jgi:hypothetical protein
MMSPRADFVNNVDVYDHGIDAKTGCAILFIYYLHSQLGYSINQIVAAAAPELAGVYQNLTGDPNDPFPDFKGLLDYHFPGTTGIPGPNPDNPFPLSLPPQRPKIPHLEIDMWNWVSWGVKVDGGGPTGNGPVPPWNPFARELAAGFVLSELAGLVSPELRESVNKLAAEQVRLASLQIAERMLTAGKLGSEKAGVGAATFVHPRPRTAHVTPAGTAPHGSIEAAPSETER